MHTHAKVSGLAIELIFVLRLVCTVDNRTERLCILLTASSTVSFIPPVQPSSSLSSMSVGLKTKKYCPKIVASAVADSGGVSSSVWPKKCGTSCDDVICACTYVGKGLWVNECGFATVYVYIGVHCVYMYTAVCGLGREGGDIHKHTGKEPQGSVSVVLLQDVCVHCTCVYLTVHVCVWVRGRHTSKRSVHVYTVYRKWASFSFFLLL